MLVAKDNKYLAPQIASITTLGELTIQWNMDIVRPTNDTLFEEQLKRKVLIEELVSGQKIMVPAFDV